MKNILLVALISCYFSHANAQKIHFADTTNKWLIRRSYADGNNMYYYNIYYSYKGVVTQDTFVYYALSAHGEDTNDTLLVREDTLQHKVFARIYYNTYIGDTSNNEFVLYDYNLNAGDTFTVDNYLHPRWLVTSTDSILINSFWHKTYTMRNIDMFQSDVEVIEGIGCVNDLLLPAYGFFYEEDKRMLCFENNTGHPSVSPTQWGFDNTTSCALSVEPVANGHETITIFPQPATNSFTIQLPHFFPSGSIRVYNALGQDAYANTFSNKATLQLSGLTGLSGLYFYLITDNTTQKAYAGKITFY